GSSVLVSRSKIRFWVFCPVKELAGISPKICVNVSVLKSGATVKVWKAMLALVPLTELVMRETDKLVAERLSGVRKRLANSPDCLNLKCWVWAAMAKGKDNIRATTNTCFISFSYLLCAVFSYLCAQYWMG